MLIYFYEIRFNMCWRLTLPAKSYVYNLRIHSSTQNKVNFYVLRIALQQQIILYIGHWQKLNWVLALISLITQAGDDSAV
jgi:hypothetical protein